MKSRREFVKTAAVAPSLPETGIDLYVGAGGSPEAVLAAAALKCLGGDMQVRMWFHNEEHKAEVAAQVPPAEVREALVDAGGPAAAQRLEQQPELGPPGQDVGGEELGRLRGEVAHPPADEDGAMGNAE